MRGRRVTNTSDIEVRGRGQDSRIICYDVEIDIKLGPKRNGGRRMGIKERHNMR
jgi:hypothetical protein